jgi:Domain of unknown function (DUF4145)
MKRDLWTNCVSEHSCPAWPCPKCRGGSLRLRKESLTHVETVESLRWHNQDDWGPEHIEFTFSAWADCPNERCKERFAIVGNGGIEPEYTGDEDGSTEWVNQYYPKFVIPTVPMIELPAKCPNSVANALSEAFALYWSQQEACAGRVRVAIEELLTHLGIPKDEVNAVGKSTPLRLHRRIELFAKQNPEIGAQLMALKWLGNTGSHGNEVTREDVLDGLELLEHALVEVLDKRSEKMTALAKKLIQKHGPSAP